MYNKVKQFNREILNVPEREQNTLSVEEIEISLISLHEEVDEFTDAAMSGNMVGMVDAIFDGIYFGLGVLHKMGISEEKAERIFDVIHEANMRKTFGTNAKRDTGAADAVKPEAWQPPEELIRMILEESETQH